MVKRLFLKICILMEIKINRAVPIWFTKILSEYDIYPVSFSKYGTEYKQYVMENLKRKDEFVCLNQFLQQQQTIQSVLASINVRNRNSSIAGTDNWYCIYVYVQERKI